MDIKKYCRKCIIYTCGNLNGVQEAGSSNLLTQTFNLRCDDASEVFLPVFVLNWPFAVADASACRCKICMENSKIE